MVRLIIALLLVSVSSAAQPETIPLPREVEILTIMPRDITGQPIPPDPPSVTRGSITNLGTYNNPIPFSPRELNQRQLDLLRALDTLKLVDPVDGLDSKELDQLRLKLLGPELILVKPRVVK